jgi:ADYC domain
MQYVTLKPQILAGCLASIVVGGCSRSDIYQQTSPQPPLQAAAERCKKWRFRSPKQPGKPSGSRMDCTPDQCGLNGMWFGEGVSFRELHLNGAANDQGLKLIGITPPHPLGRGKEPVLGIDGDELLIKDKQSGKVLLEGRRLRGTVLLIEKADSSAEQAPNLSFECWLELKWNPNLSRKCRLEIMPNLSRLFRLKITDVFERNFWDCKPGDGHAKECKVFHYVFQATTNAATKTVDDGCEVEICAPELAQNLRSTDSAIQGTAVVFAGDVYDERHKVRSVSASPTCPGDALAPDETDIINFACPGTVPSKLHLMRHTAASERKNKKGTTISQRQAMLRMLTADYCGNGHSFTRDGTPIRFGTEDWSFINSYRIDKSMTLEAVWTARGASCLYQPRLATYDQIAAVCPTMPPRCSMAHPDVDLMLLSPPLPNRNCSDSNEIYLISALAPLSANAQ